MRKLWCIFLPVLFLGPLLIHAQEETPPAPQLRRDLVPQTWERKIPAGTALAAIKERYETRLATRMLATDLEDQSPLPFWFRAYMRDQHPSLPTTGKYQYLLVSEQILDWMVAHPDLKIPPAGAASRQLILPLKWIAVGTNINISNLSAINSESAVAVDYSSPQYVIAASNNISGTGRQKQFRSSDYGANWTKTELPLAPGSAFHSDPAVAFTSTGTAWAATLGIDSTGTVVQVQVYKSTDHGATWTYNATLSSGNSNDKEMMWIDNYPSSPFNDHIYVVWDVGNGMRFRRSPDGGNTWGNIVTLSSDSAIGSHVTTGPSGEVYVAWPDTTSRELRIRKSTDGGASFAAASVIAKTNDSYEITIPPFCQRKALIYVSLGVDRSNGPHRGNVYAAWTDRNGTATDPGCSGTTSDSNSNVYASVSTDGGHSWATPKVIHTDVAKTDQFNQWLDVDPTDGSVHVIFYDTRNDSNRKKTDIYYVKSSDGGSTWRAETKVTTLQTDETVTGADLGNQYGDYNGLAIYQNLGHPVWTDRRTGTPGNHEQIYTASIQEKSIFKPPLTICDAHPQLCQSITHLPGRIVLACTTKPCLNFDHFPENCTRKFTCPGCPPGGLCPPYYNFYIDDPLPDWQVSLLGPKGEKVEYKLSKTAHGLVLSFRPSKELYQEGSIGDYFVQFKPGPSVGVKTQKRVKVRLEVSDKPYSPPK